MAGAWFRATVSRPKKAESRAAFSLLRRFVAIGLGALLTVSFVFEAAAQESAQEKSDLVVGRASSNPTDSIPKLKPFSRYLAKKLDGLGIKEGKVVIVRDSREMAEALRSGRIDVFSETPFSAIDLIDRGLAEPLLREWKKGVSSYHSVFISRKDRPISSLGELKGKIVAFEDPESTSAFFLPLAALRAEGLEVAELSSIHSRPPADKVGYLFARGEVNIAAWVVKGAAAAGAFSNLDWEDLERTPNAVRKHLRVFHETASVVRSLVLVRPGLPRTYKDALREILIRMPDDEEAARVLKKYNEVKKFDAIDEEIQRSLENTRRAMAYIREELNR